MGSSGRNYHLYRDSPNMLERLRIKSSVDDIRSPYFWRAVLAELIGTMLLVLVGCASTLSSGAGDILVVRISLCFGLSVGTIVWAIAHVSGGHINPAVTLAMFVTRNVSLVRAFLYIAAQIGGAAAGAGILYSIVPVAMRGSLGVNSPGFGVTDGQAVGVEILVTFVLVLVVFATVDPKRADMNGSGPLSIGLSIAMCHLAFIPITGSSQNPARSFGPAVITGNMSKLWIYWVGPLAGGLVAGILYEFFFAANASTRRWRGCLLGSRYNGGEFDSVRDAEKITVVDEKANGHVELEIKE